MKAKLLYAFLLPLFSFSLLADVNVKLDNRVSVNFPAQPEEKEMSGNEVWVADGDAGTRCMAMVLDFKKFGMDSASLAEEMGKEESFAQFKDGILGQIEGATLISEKKTKTGKYMTFEYKIDMGKSDPSALNVMYNKNVFVGDHMYSFSFYELNNKPEDAARNRFFNSIKIQ